MSNLLSEFYTLANVEKQSGSIGLDGIDLVGCNSVTELEKLFLGPFDSDLAKSIESKAFRRLYDKAQVVPGSKNIHSHIRTRATHSFEVANIGKLIAKMLNFEFRIRGLEISLNEVLCFVIGIDHDLGHTPFGHIGEKFLRQKGFRFNHNEFSVVVAKSIERGGLGLGLHWATLKGMLNHTTNGGELSLQEEIQEIPIGRTSDKLAYVPGDFNDGVRLGYLDNHIARKIADKLGTSQKERVATLVKEVVLQTIHHGYVTLGNGQVAKDYKDLKKLLKDDFYGKKDAETEQECFDMLENVYDLIKTSIPEIRPEIGIALLTDTEVININNLLDEGKSCEEIISSYHISLFDIINDFKNKGNNLLDIKIEPVIL